MGDLFVEEPAQAVEEPVEVTVKEEEGIEDNADVVMQETVEVDPIDNPVEELPDPSAFAPTHVSPESDPVVKSVPVFLSSEAKDRLVLLQYPTRKAGTPGANKETVQLRIKPGSQVVETDVLTGLPMQYVDAYKAERWGDSGVQTFGGLLKPAKGRYAVGRLNGDGTELHLSVVAKTGQLRPQFAHHNRQSEAKETKPAPKDANSGVRAVQMSAKTSGDQAVKFSDVLEFWKDANDEEFATYAVEGSADAGEVLQGGSKEPLEVAEGYDERLRF